MSAGTGQWHTKARMHKQAYRHRKTPALGSLSVIEGLVRVGRSAFFEGSGCLERPADIEMTADKKHCGNRKAAEKGLRL
jgi:hypothetical protein